MFKKRKLFNDFIEEWLGVHREKIKESTYVTYYNHCENHIKPYFKGYLLKQLNHQMIQQFINEQLCKENIRTGQPLSVKTVKEMTNVLKLSLKYAMKRGYIKDIDLHFTFPKHNQSIHIMNQHDYYILVQYLKEKESPFHTGILMMLCMGLRVGEICALKNEDINLVKKEIYIHSTLQRVQDFQNKNTKIIITPVKTMSSHRTIPIPDTLVQYIHIHDDDSFFLTQTQKFTEPRIFRYKFTRIINKLQIEHVTVHSLRHYFASQCIELGFDYNCLSEILGHSSPSTTMNVYVHCQDKYKQECMNKIQI